MQIEDILDDLPTTVTGQAELIAHLLEMIDHWNAGIARHESYPEPDLSTIEGFTKRRNTYVGQLALLLNQHGVIVQLPTAPDTPHRVAA